MTGFVAPKVIVYGMLVMGFLFEVFGNNEIFKKVAFEVVSRQIGRLLEIEKGAG